MTQLPISLTMSLEYERLGFSIIPLLPHDKRPNWRLLPLNGKSEPTWTPFQIERADTDRIMVWWDTCPDGNVGIVTGAVSGVIVLDVDGPEGSDQLTGRDMPRTPYVATGKGYHYYFKHPGFETANFARKLPGLDFRGDGGYVVAPPSIHPSGSRYAWAITPNQEPFADAPEWLVSLLREKDIRPAPPTNTRPMQVGGSNAAYASKAFQNELSKLQATGEGSRNHQLNASAFSLGQLVAIGELSESEVVSGLTSVALSIGLKGSEIARTIASGLEAGRLQPRDIPQKSALVVRQAAPQVIQPTEDDLIGIADVSAQAKERAIDWAQHPKEIRGYRTGIEELDSALSGILDSDIVIILGRTGGGKSTLATQFLCSIAAQDARILTFTTEMTPEWYLHRIASYQIGVNSKDIFTGALGKENAKLLSAYDKAGHWPIDFYRHDNPTPDLIIRKAEQAQARGAKGVILDSLNNVFTPGRSVYDGTKDTMAALRHIARGLGMFVIATCQANRGPSDRANKEPLLTDAQGGGVIEQDATRFLTIYRPGYDIETRQVKADAADPIDPRVAYITVVKDRMFSAQGRRIETLWEAGRGYQKLTKRTIDLGEFSPAYAGNGGYHDRD